jgi:(2Fe-2S) ferredoxin
VTAGTDTGCTITVCRDCCCGTWRKHPDVDHDEQIARLTRHTNATARVVVSSCLLVCERSNVMVVTPGRPGRRAGGRPTWFQHVLDDGTVDAIAEWVWNGGPGLAALPDRIRPMLSSGRAADSG